MRDLDAELLEGERTAGEASERLRHAIDQLRDELTPSHVVNRIGQSARDAVAPLLAPVLGKANESRTMIGLGLATAAFVFGLGRASVATGSTSRVAAETSNGKGRGTADAPKVESGASPAGRLADAAPNSASKRDMKSRDGGRGQAILLSAAGLAVGSALGAVIPLTGQERHFAKTGGQDLKRWGRSVFEDHSAEMVGRAVNAFGFTKAIGIGMGILGLAAARLGSPDAKGPGKSRDRDDAR